MAQLLQAPTEGYEDAIVVPAITADNFELKHGLLTLVQNKQFYGLDKEDPHSHLRYFNKITSTLKFPNVPNTPIKLMLFLFSLEGATGIWLEKEPPRSILTWDDLVSKFINHFFPPSKTTSLRNAITNFQQRFDETFSEAWDRFKDLFRACPHHDFSELHHLDTFYNALNSKDQDSLHSAAGGNFLDKMPCDCLSIIQSKSKVRYSRDKPVVTRVSMTASTSVVSPDVAELKDLAPAYQDPAPETQGISKEDFLAYVKANDAVMKNMKTQGTLPSNTIANPKSDLKAIPTRSGMSYDGPQIPPPVVKNEPEATKDTIFKDMSFEISFADALILMPKFTSTLKALIGNKEKLSEMAQTPLNEHCSTVLLKKLPEKLGDPGKFLIPSDFPRMAECLALADLGASINLMPLSVWKKLSLSKLTPTCMTLKLADRSISRQVGIAEDVYIKTGRALIDVFEGELTLRVGKEAIAFNLDQTLRYSANYSDMTAKRIDVIDMACEEYSQEVLGFFDTISSGNPTPCYDTIVFATSLTLTPFGNSDFLLEEQEVIKLLDDGLIYPISDTPWVSPVHCVPNKRGITVVENEDNELIPTRLVMGWRVCIDYHKLNEATQKDHFPLSFMDQMLERLARNQYYCFLDGFSGYFHIPINPKAQDKTTFTCPYRTFAYRRMPFGLCNAPGTFQRCMMEKSHFMVKEGIVLGHKISKKGIEVDKAKVDVISKLPHPTTIKGIRSFLGHAGFYRRFIKDFSKIARPMTKLLEKDTPFIFSKECVDAFQTLKRKLTEAPILIASDWDMPFELMCDASDFAIRTVLGQRQDKHFVGNKMLQGIPTASYGDPPASAFSHYEDHVNAEVNAID
uniref:DNA-directed DNA polymerase n=1 Tax=Tanacetum cinerariifolium TaxID=118510 RepID=A0A699HKM7_TANCI|nr:DNA-directed DNA polymerase [Tanacetum cinerariifolium]